METFRIGAVAAGLGTTAKAIRNWLDRGQASLTHARRGKYSWISFSLDDVVHLALVHLFVGLGRRVEQATQLAQVTAELVGAMPGEPDPASRWKGKLLYIKRDDANENWHLSIFPDTSANYSHGLITVDIATEITAAIARARAARASAPRRRPSPPLAGGGERRGRAAY